MAIFVLSIRPVLLILILTLADMRDNNQQKFEKRFQMRFCLIDDYECYGLLEGATGIWFFPFTSVK